MTRLLPVILFSASTLIAQATSVQGRVVNRLNGGPVGRASVILRALASGARSYTTETDRDGAFAFDNVLPGKYEGVAAREGYGNQPPDMLAYSAYFPEIEIRTAAVTGFTLSLTPLSVISGRVVDSDGDPVAGVAVSAMQYGYGAGGLEPQSRKTAATDDRGQYRLSGLFKGTYYLHSDQQPVQTDWTLRSIPANRGRDALVPLVSTYYPAALDADQAKPVEVPAGGEITSIDIVAQRRAFHSVGGRILGAGDNYVSVNLQKLPLSSGAVFGSCSGGQSQGRQWYQCFGLPAGRYLIVARTIQSPKGMPVTGRQPIEIADNDIEDADLNVTPGLEISGVVHLNGRKALPSGSLVVAAIPVERGDASSPVPSRRTPVMQAGELASMNVNQNLGAVAADGSFTIHTLLPDLYQIRLTPPNAVWPQSVKVNERELPDRMLDLRQGASGPVSIEASTDVGRVAGVVRDDQGNAFHRANVVLVPDQSKWDWPDRYTNMLTDAEGKFSFDKVAPGDYQLFAWKDAPSGAPSNAEFRKPFEAFAATVHVAPGDSQPVVLRLITTRP